MKRVLCLYRVSTLKQVDKQDDIPMQRRECMDFINRMDGWTEAEVMRVRATRRGMSFRLKSRSLMLKVSEIWDRLYLVVEVEAASSEI